jgi:hypothetical protein
MLRAIARARKCPLGANAPVDLKSFMLCRRNAKGLALGIPLLLPKVIHLQPFREKNSGEGIKQKAEKNPTIGPIGQSRPIFLLSAFSYQCIGA